MGTCQIEHEIEGFGGFLVSLSFHVVSECGPLPGCRSEDGCTSFCELARISFRMSKEPQATSAGGDSHREEFAHKSSITGIKTGLGVRF